MSLRPRIWAPAASSSLASADIIFEVVFGPGRIEDVAGVADRRLRRACPPRPPRPSTTRMFSTQFRQSKTRNRSTPPFAAWRDEDTSRHCRDSWCSRRRWRRAAASAAGGSGAASRTSDSRSHGSSVRKRMATSKVAPPQHSSENKLRQRARIGAGDARRCRSVRMRVASSDWCAVAHRRVGEQHALLLAHPARRTSSGRAASSTCLRAVGQHCRSIERHARAPIASAGGVGRPRVSGWPLTVTSAM